MIYFFHSLISVNLNSFTKKNNKRPSLLFTFTDQQSLYWIYFNLFSNASFWFTLFLSVITAIVPDLVIKASENVNDSEQIKKIKQTERELTVNFNKNNLNNNNNNNDKLSDNSSKNIINDNQNSQTIIEKDTEEKSTTKKKTSSESEKFFNSTKFRGGTARITPK